MTNDEGVLSGKDLAALNRGGLDFTQRDDAPELIEAPVPLAQVTHKEDLPIEGMDLVLYAIDPEVHSASIVGFLTGSCPDLVCPHTDVAMSPRDWLLAGYDVSAVIEIARFL